MIEFSLNKTKIQLDFSFFAVLAFCFFLDSNNILLMSFAACIIHETGHLITMLLFHVDIRSLYFYGAGIKLGSCIRYTGFQRKIIILLAGSSANLIICAFAFYSYCHAFAAINLVIGVFNLLSIGDLDGRQIISAVSDQYRLPAILTKTADFMSYVLVLFVSLFYGDIIGITFYLTLLYMFLIR